MSATPAALRGWERLNARLMPDFNRGATLFWWAVVLGGALALAWQLAALRALPAAGWAQIAAAALLATLAGLAPVRLPGMRQAFTAGEIFIYLLLLLQGPEAAALAAALEAAAGAWRSASRWTSRLQAPAVAALAMAAVGAVMALGLRPLAGVAPGSPLFTALPVPTLLLVMTGLAALNLALSSQLTGAVPRLNRSESPWRLAEWPSTCRWVGLVSLGSGLVAGLLFVAYREAGAAALVAALPVLLLLLAALHLHFLTQAAVAAKAVVAARAAQAAEQQLATLRASEQRFHGAFTHAAIGMALLALDGRLELANPALRQLLGLAPDDPLPERFQLWLDADQRAGFEQHLQQGTSAQPFGAFQLELRARHSAGHALWLLAHCGFFQTERDATSPSAADTADASTGRLILQVQDISARRQAEAGLHRLAFHDSLTGLPNRRQLMDSLGAAVQRQQADARAMYALMYLDFDGFKLVNDNLGHKVGDTLLVQLARRIQENLRPSDVVARLGGDEFAVLVPQLHGDQDAVQLAERLVAALRRPFLVDGHPLFASASIGVTFSRFGYTSADDVLRDADSAMYQAKSAGKARFVLFNGGMPQGQAPQPCQASELRTALENAELQVDYQPLVDLSSGQLRGFEALVRWQHPRAGLLQPAAFVPLAEAAGLITRLTEVVLARACRQLVQWQRLGPAWAELTMCVNLSAQDLASRDTVARVAQVLADTGLAPQHLVLELTEDAVMGHLDSGAVNLKALRGLGVRLSVDDFGTGYSSLSRLARLPIDSFKIDRSFVHELASLNQQGDLADDSAVVRALVQMGGALGKTVVAEGIETALQADQLRRMGAGLLGQGYHLAEPLNAADATAWLHRQPQRPPELMH